MPIAATSRAKSPAPGAGASRRRAQAASASARLALVDLLLECPDPESAASVALSWLREHADVVDGLCMADLGDRLVAIAAVGGARAAAERFSFEQPDPQHPLVAAVEDLEPVRLARADLAPAAWPEPLSEREGLFAVPLRRRARAGSASVGLLVVRTGGRELAGEATWAASLLASVLAEMEGGRLRGIERTHRQSRGHWHGILNALPDPVLLTDADGRIVVANERAERLFFAAESDSEGRRRAVALNNMLFSAALFTTLHEDAATGRELPLVDPIDARDLLFELLRTPLDGGRSGVVSVLRDVTDLRSAVEQLEDHVRRAQAAKAAVRVERDRLDLMLHAVAEPILVTDPSGNVILMNAPAERFFNFDSPSLSHDERRRALGNDAVFSSFLSKLYAEKGRSFRGELNLVDMRTGDAVPMDALAGKVLSKRGEVTAVVTTLHDKSEAIEKARLLEQVRRHSEELSEKVREATAELAEQNELLRRQALALEQASQLKSQFLANMSHELRTPLNAIMGYTQLLLMGGSGELTPAQRKKLTRVDANARHLLAIISDLLDIARIESGRMPLHVEPFEIGALIDDVLSELEPLIAKSGIAVETHVPARLPHMKSDRQKVKQVVVNLLSNALKFTPEGRVSVEVRREVEADEILVAVTDTGIGIPAEELERVFEDFRQADSSYTRQYPGTGLGLSISRRLANMLGGGISAQSEVGKGSTFSLRIPRRVRKTK